MRLTAPLASSSLRRLHYEGRSLLRVLAVDTTGSDPFSPIDRGTKLLVNFFNSSFMMSNHQDPRSSAEELDSRSSETSKSDSPPTLIETALISISISRPSIGVISLEEVNYQKPETLGEEEGARDHA